MRLSQIIAEADDHVNYDGLDPNVIERLSKYKSHQQQWAVKELREGGDVNSVVDALDYYIAKIGDNRFQNILKSKTPTPKNILSLSLDDIKAAQHDFETKYNSLSKRERERLKSNVILNIPGLKVVEFKKSDPGDVDTAKALAVAAQFTNWCVVNTETGNHYLDKGPIYLITMGKAEYKVVVPGGQPVATNQYLCQIESEQFMDVLDAKAILPRRAYTKMKKHIPMIGIFCDTLSKEYRDAIKHDIRKAYNYANDVIHGRWPEAEPTIMQDPEYIYYYACNVIHDRWPEAESYILKQLNSNTSWPGAETSAHDNRRPYKIDWVYNYIHSVIRGRWPEVEPYIMRDKHLAYEYALHIIKGRWPEAEPYIIQNPNSACNYASTIIRGRWPQAEQFIINNEMVDGSWVNDAYSEPTTIKQKLIRKYANDVIRGRWLEAEPYVLREVGGAYEYARDVINGRWPEAEPTIMKEPFYACQYARDVIRGRWPEAEPTIMKSPSCAYQYAIQVIKGRWPKAEPTIMQNPQLAYYYAREVIKGRWREAEPTIMQDPQRWNQYQRFLRDKGES